MYRADPFAARKEVDERQSKAAKTRNDTNDNNSGTTRSQPISTEFANVPEVKMVGALREVVEAAIKEVTIIGFHTFQKHYVIMAAADYPPIP
jgi:ATP-dependent RNA helicase DHX57